MLSSSHGGTPAGGGANADESALAVLQSANRYERAGTLRNKSDGDHEQVDGSRKQLSLPLPIDASGTDQGFSHHIHE
jgi:hypothetical protein